MASLNSIGTSALLAFQRSLATVGHNIANASVEGYSRQRVEFTTRTPEFTGAGYIGSGIQVESITRIFDQFLINNVRTNTTSFSQSDHFYQLASQVDNLLADQDAGLSPSLQSFFNALQEVADDPSSTSARQVLLSESETLVQRFESIDTRIRELGINVDRDIDNLTTEINSYATALARLNQDIILGSQNNGRIQPNDLLDARDQLIRELSEIISVSTVAQNDGALNIFIGSGQALVIGTTASQLATVNNAFDPSRNDVVIQQGGVSINITDQLTGGRLGATLDFRNRIIDPALNSLGRLATGLATIFNARHVLGVDLQGNAGGAYFAVGTIDVLPSANNTGAATVTAALTDVSSLTTSDYQLNYDGANYTVTRLSDGVNLFTGNLAAINAATIDGFQLTVGAGANAGDIFRIQPTRDGGRDIGLLINDAARIAAADPLRSTTTLSNTGDATIALVPVSNTNNIPLAADIVLTFNPNAGGAGVPGFDVAGGPATPILYDPATEAAGKSFTLAGGYDGITFTIAGTPATGDTLTISNNTNGVGDNRNALQLADLQNAISLAGNNTFQSAYGLLVAEIGTRTRQAEITRDSQEVLLEQSVAARESVSGVNLDEEAANLIRLQQAYQAAAQVIAISDSLFQQLIAALQR